MSATREGVPVLVTNPRPEDFEAMARKKKTTKRKPRRRAPARNSSPKRRRSPRRKKNPAADVMGTVVAGGAGAVIGLAQTYLDAGTDLSPTAQAGLMAAVGGVGGVALGMLSGDAGKGIAGAGLAMTAYLLASDYMAKQPAKAKKLGAVGYAPQLGAVGYAPGYAGQRQRAYA